MADNERPGDESEADYASSEWLWCCGDADPLEDGLGPLDSKSNRMETSSDLLGKERSTSARYRKGSQQNEPWRKKRDNAVDKENEGPLDNCALPSYESKNHYLVRQNHDSKTINGQSLLTIAKLREARNNLVREGDIRHKAFKEAHFNIMRKSESKKKEMSMISNEELKHLIVDRIIKSQRKQEASRSSFIAEPSEPGRAGSGVAYSLAAKFAERANLDYEADDCEASQVGGGLHSVENESHSPRRVLSELGLQAITSCKKEIKGRDIDVEAMCYTKSNNGLTDRDAFMMTVDDQNTLKDGTTSRKNRSSKHHDQPETEDAYKQLMFYDSVDYYGDDENNKVDPRFHDLNLEKTTEITPVDDRQVEQGLDERKVVPISLSNVKKSENSFDNYINIEFVRNHQLGYNSETPYQDMSSLMLGESDIEGTDRKAKSTRSKQKMDDFALRMDTINKRLEALKAPIVEEHVEELIVKQLDSSTHYIDHQQEEVRAVCLSYNSLSAVKKELGTPLETGSKVELDSTDLHKVLFTDEKFKDSEKNNDMDSEEVNEIVDLDQNRRKLPKSYSIKKTNLKSSDLLIMTILETYEEPSTLRGEEQIAQSQISLIGTGRTERQIEEQENVSINENTRKLSNNSTEKDVLLPVQPIKIEPYSIVALIEFSITQKCTLFIEPVERFFVQNLIIDSIFECFKSTELIETKPHKALEPYIEELEIGYYFNQLSNPLFNNTMSSSQFMFDNQAEIFGHDEAYDDHIFQGFLNADCLNDDLDREKHLVGFDKKQVSHTKKLVKRYAQESHTVKASRRLSGSRYTLNTSKGLLKTVENQLQEEDSMLVVKRTLNTEFERADQDIKQNTAKSETKQSALDEPKSRSLHEPIAEKPTPTPADRAMPNSVREETSTSKTRPPKAATKPAGPRSPDQSPQRAETLRANGSAAKANESHPAGRSTSQSCSSIKKGIYKLLASSNKDADISDYLFIDKQLDLLDQSGVHDGHQDILNDEPNYTAIDPRAIVQNFENLVTEKFQPMRSQEFSSYCGMTNNTERFQFTKRFTNHAKPADEDEPHTTSLLPPQPASTGHAQTGTAMNDQDRAISRQLAAIQESLSLAGLGGHALFRGDASASASTLTDHKRYSSSRVARGRRPSLLETSHFRSREENSEFQSAQKTKKLQFSALERWYAKEKNIGIELVASKSEFRHLCLESSMKDRENRAHRISLATDAEQDVAEANHSFSQNESQISAGDNDGKYISELLTGVQQVEKKEEIAPNLAQNSLCSVLTMLLTIERESRKVIRLLQICPGFNIIDFVDSSIQSFGRQIGSEENHVLNKNSVFKLMKSFGSKCPMKVFDSYWGVKFGKASINKDLFAEEYFKIEVPKHHPHSDHVAQPVNISSYSSTVKGLLGLLFDLSIKEEIYFQREKSKITLPSIISFTKQVCSKERDSILVSELLCLSVFSEFSKEDSQVVSRRLFKATKSDLISAYNLCIMVS
jgi:hypothetical protein